MHGAAKMCPLLGPVVPHRHLERLGLVVLHYIVLHKEILACAEVPSLLATHNGRGTGRMCIELAIILM